MVGPSSLLFCTLDAGRPTFWGSFNSSVLQLGYYIFLCSAVNPFSLSSQTTLKWLRIFLFKILWSLKCWKKLELNISKRRGFSNSCFSHQFVWRKYGSDGGHFVVVVVIVDAAVVETKKMILFLWNEKWISFCGRCYWWSPLNMLFGIEIHFLVKKQANKIRGSQRSVSCKT